MIGTSIVFATIVFSSAMMMSVATVVYKRGVNNAPIALFLVGLVAFGALIFGSNLGNVIQSEKAALVASKSE